MKRKIFTSILTIALLAGCAPSGKTEITEPAPQNTTETVEQAAPQEETAVNEQAETEQPETSTEAEPETIPDSIYEQGDSIPERPTPKNDRLTVDEAREKALQHAGLSIDEVTVKEEEFELDNGVPEYQFEFLKDGIEYSVDIHAETGEILEYEKEAQD